MVEFEFKNRWLSLFIVPIRHPLIGLYPIDQVSSYNTFTTADKSFPPEYKLKLVHSASINCSNDFSAQVTTYLA